MMRTHYLKVTFRLYLANRFSLNSTSLYNSFYFCVVWGKILRIHLQTLPKHRRINIIWHVTLAATDSFVPTEFWVHRIGVRKAMLMMKQLCNIVSANRKVVSEVRLSSIIKWHNCLSYNNTRHRFDSLWDGPLSWFILCLLLDFFIFSAVQDVKSILFFGRHARDASLLFGIPHIHEIVKSYPMLYFQPLPFVRIIGVQANIWCHSQKHLRRFFSFLLQFLLYVCG